MRPMLAAAAVAATMVLSSTAVAAPPQARNFVPLDEKFYGLIDTASIRRDGDTATFDKLSVATVSSFGFDGAPGTSEYRASLSTWRISCGRRSGGTVGTPTAYNANGTLAEERRGPSDQAEAFLMEGSYDGALAARVCAARPEAWPKGAPTIAAALKAATDAKGPLSAPSGMLPIGPATPRPVWAGWMPVGGAAQFRDLGIEQPGGGRLFFHTNTAVAGKVEAVTFSVFGQAAHRATTEYDAAALMQLVHYDCRARTLQVLRQASWNRFGRLQSVGEIEGASREAAESPLLTAEIAAACAGAVSGTAFDGYDTAWASVRAGWAPAPRPSWTAICMDRALPADVPLAGQLAPPVEARLAAAMKSCGVPAADRQTSRNAVRALRRQREAMAALKAAAGIEEPRLAAAWRNLTWADRQLVIKNRRASGIFDREDEAVVLAGIALELDVSDYGVIEAIGDYVKATAELENIWPSDL